ncbi:Flagellar biosynthesis protein, FliO [Hoeflea phototrophica DFL-43]|uniref:Flagellar biosynthesis protein, FliO n=1 Tax=Hoeflea phototrophica (strain DSM 17068 / NCIMB 14078 / DFL-43) TaxID=411684 RepID=A9D6G0_HOEPD|nr:flagellar biosynthetic protein FliO [Hoeflea phototrophica]EDQ33493.1 Flagellar biosynthesis protein, FliO [Hoeflea phototrophica DFL-43]
MPDDILGGQGTTLLTAIAIVAVALLALAVAFWLIKARSSSTFIRGGRARQPRLAVLDAAAVDTRRRIVLIRRDDVEHLVMIGGPTDVVIESRIVASDAAAGNPAHSTAPESEKPSTAADPLPADLMATAKSIVRSAQEPVRKPHPEPAPARAPEPPVARSVTVGAAAAAAAATASGAASVAGSLENEAADILESARARVFDEPDFNSEAPAMEPASAPAATPQSMATATPAAYEENLADQDLPSTSWPDPVETVEPAPQPSPEPQPAAAAEPGLDFESVLAAELSEDLSLDPFDGGLIDDTIDQTATAQPIEAPEVQSEAKPSRDSLEAEMERLLSDMARKPGT